MKPTRIIAFILAALVTVISFAGVPAMAKNDLPMHACCRHDPGGTAGCLSRSLPRRYQPSPSGAATALDRRIVELYAATALDKRIVELYQAGKISEAIPLARRAL